VIIRVAAFTWFVLCFYTSTVGARAILGGQRVNPTSQLTTFLNSVRPFGRWQLLASLVLGAALLRGFFTGSTNTSLWPWASAAWVALVIQLLFLRPHMSDYVEIVERGFDRPVHQFVLVHLAFDLGMLGILGALTISGVS
jgi:hypothetical protein